MCPTVVPLQINRMGAKATVAAWALTMWALFLPAAHAQVAVDNTSFVSGDTATLSFPHTVNSEPDPLLMVGVEVHAQTRVTSVQWGAGSICSSECTPAICACALSQVGTVTDGGKNITVQLWKLVNPPAGSGNIVVTLPSSHRLVSGATSFFGVDQGQPLGSPVMNSGDSGNPTVSVSNASGQMVLDAVGTSPNTALTVTGDGQTQQYQGSVNGGASSAGVSGGGSTTSGAAAVTMSWSSASANWAIIAVPINPAPTRTGAPRTATPSPTPTIIVSCVGDCSGTHSVAVDDVITLVNIVLGNAQPAACPEGIPAGGEIDVTLIIQAVSNALNGCS